MLARRHGIVDADVGNVDQLGVLEAARIAFKLEQAQVEGPHRFGEPYLLILVQRLIAKNQHRMPVHAGVDLAHLFLGERLCEVEAAGNGCE